ncbi:MULTISPECIES: BMP family ABC transporter substrate-binding protein [Kosmotoga]|uniref:Basic membrane lipoprotein n=1 Tax=Kosmotoga olearia (strain ATCC BAA-1733 / DSM 21960 / TBF 19.5.1) TaxID=521045 RepID=C5CGZ5_KOSOT|nr:MULTISPECIES: BMP family ABC transporter substrate-binding protein [Kosmotoga]ACR79660.1 basic membrane lipoprotein [Kosmotoga olearia TBF 19.5.1]MDI3523897.1 basic rane protein [Kosmotoga sp.]MDK2953681.1 basic rane protein [Kosmotoga sp.]OAA21900.1 membrane protein [Kosmotoga sp. DU53]
MKKLGSFGLILLMGLSIFALKIGFVYVGPVSDAGWSYAHDQGRQYLEKIFPGIETMYFEAVPEGAESVARIRQLAADGCDIVFTTSFGYMDPTLEVAKDFPDTIFMHCSGFKRAENVGTYFGRIYQADFLVGMVAGAMTKTNIIGYVAPHPIPEVVRGINAFTLGVRKVNPYAVVKVVWVNAWFDPATEKEAALSLIEAGADVVAHGQDSPAVNQTAQEHGVWSIGYNNDMSAFAPESHLTAAIWNWGPLYEKIVKSVIDGTWKSEDLWPGLEMGVVDIAPIHSAVPRPIRAFVETYKKRIALGQYKIFEGPIKDQNGEVRIPEGVVPSDEELLSMYWFVEGVEGTLPESPVE